MSGWIDSGEYDRILAGEYPKRTDEPPPLTDDLKQAGGYYSDRARDAVNIVGDVMSRARDAFNQAWQGAGGRTRGGGETGGTNGEGQTGGSGTNTTQ